MRRLVSKRARHPLRPKAWLERMFGEVLTVNGSDTAKHQAPGSLGA